MFTKDKTCRCCLKEFNFKSELYEFSSEMSLDDDVSNYIKINDCYKKVAGVDLDEESEDSTKICSECLGDLKYCYLFQKKCLDSEKIYTSRFGKKATDIVFEELQEPVTEFEYVEEEYIEASIEDIRERHDTTESMHDDEDIELETATEEDVPSDVHSERQYTSVDEGDSEAGGFMCEMCPKVYHRKDLYRRHFKRNHLDQAIEETKDRITDEGRISEILDLQIYKCDICDKISVTKDEHVAHEQTHSYNCKKCDAHFSSKEEARFHYSSAHSDDDKLHDCEVCPKKFKNRYQLLLHNRSHTGEKPFECPTCLRCFSLSSNLQKHMDTHQSEKTFECSECNQNFKTQRSLKFHTVSYHRPEAKVKCPQCDKSFAGKAYLKMHMLYHTGEKNFTCSLCYSKYYKSSHLKRHIQNVHFKIRAMKCEFCPSDFVRKETYRAHVMSNHRSSLTEAEFDDVMDRIRKFQPPPLDVSQYTLEKQSEKTNDNSKKFIVIDENTGEVVIEEEANDEDMIIEHETGCYEESELYDEQ